jgi:hypothetical protein
MNGERELMTRLSVTVPVDNRYLKWMPREA